MSSKSRTGAGKEELNATNSRFWNSCGGNKSSISAQMKADKDDSSDESEGRGTAIGKGKKRNNIGSIRADLLANRGSKKRKKNRGGSGQNG
jgi:hypothetical protein